jgi:tetratricopeptide (TPR) repeat protein
MSRIRKRPALTGVVTVSITVLLEAFSVLAVASDFSVGPVVDLLLAFAFHLGAAVMIAYGFWGKWDFRYPDEKNWAVIGFVMVLTIPVYGLLGYAGAFAAVHLNQNRKSSGSVVSAFEEHVAYEPEVRKVLRQGPNLLDPTPSKDDERAVVAPLVDIIKAGDPDLKRGAIFSLSRLSRKTAVKILREALHDVDPESQFYVAGQLSRIEKELSDRLIHTRRKLELEPDNIELKVQLARYGKEYIDSGLVEASVQDYFVRQAIALCEEVLEIDVERLDVLFDLAELYSIAEDHMSAATAWRRVLDLDPTDIDAKVGTARAYFELRDLESLGAILADLEQSGEAPKSLQPVLEFWRASQSRAVG